MQRTRDLDDRDEYYRLKGVAKRTIKTAKKTYWRDYDSTLDDKSKIGRVWRTLKKVSGVRASPSIPTITQNGVVYDANRSKAELFVQQFYDVSADKNLTPYFMAHRIKFERQHRDEIHSTVVTSDESNSKTINASETSSTTPDDHTINSQFEMHELTEAIKLCKSNSSPGADRISYEILKKIPKKNHSTIFFMNLVWSNGKLPTDWKELIISPILKPSKSTFDPSSYRPIALTSVLCKTMERMIATRLRYWMEERNLFNKFQCGFRKQRSCIDQIMRLAGDVHKSINKQAVYVGSND